MKQKPASKSSVYSRLPGLLNITSPIAPKKLLKTRLMTLSEISKLKICTPMPEIIFKKVVSEIVTF